jgi:hypothetical protein
MSRRGVNTMTMVQSGKPAARPRRCSMSAQSIMPKSKRKVRDYARWGDLRTSLNKSGPTHSTSAAASSHVPISITLATSLGIPSETTTSSGVHQTYLAASRSVSELRTFSFIAAHLDMTASTRDVGVNRIGAFGIGRTGGRLEASMISYGLATPDPSPAQLHSI